MNLLSGYLSDESADDPPPVPAHLQAEAQPIRASTYATAFSGTDASADVAPPLAPDHKPIYSQSSSIDHPTTDGKKKKKKLDISFLPPEIQAALTRGDSTRDSDEEDMTAKPSRKNPSADSSASKSFCCGARKSAGDSSESKLLGMLPAPKATHANEEQPDKYGFSRKSECGEPASAQKNNKSIKEDASSDSSISNPKSSKFNFCYTTTTTTTVQRKSKPENLLDTSSSSSGKGTKVDDGPINPFFMESKKPLSAQARKPSLVSQSSFSLKPLDSFASTAAPSAAAAPSQMRPLGAYPPGGLHGTNPSLIPSIGTTSTLSGAPPGFYDAVPSSSNSSSSSSGFGGSGRAMAPATTNGASTLGTGWQGTGGVGDGHGGGQAGKKKRGRDMELQLMVGDLSGLEAAGAGAVRDIQVKNTSWNPSKYREQQDMEKSVQKEFGVAASKTAMGVSKVQSRKHQLNSLVVQAAETQLAMLEKKGTRNLTKSQTQGKYGW